MSDAAVIDPNVAQRRAADPSASVWVSASAGSGKTKVLTDRVLALLLSGTEAHRILCLTFTKAAAAEMANRISRELAIWTVAEPQDLTDRLSRLLGKVPNRP
jgi:ATP-dependent exoDNAse (exonuclease V) beta subunit (contains helicase and exonuclease domains)